MKIGTNVIAKLLMLCMVGTLSNAMELETMSEQKALMLVSQNMADVLRSMVEKDIRAPNGYALKKSVVRFPWLPGYIVKLNTDRIDGAELIIKPCIDQEQLHLLRLPKMYRCPVPEKITLPDDLRIPGLWLPKELCVSEYIQGSLDAKLTMEQTRQVVVLLTKAKEVLRDCHSKNIIATPDGQLALIDTEMRGFHPRDLISHEIALSYFYKTNQFEDDAKDYLRNEIKTRFNIELS